MNNNFYGEQYIFTDEDIRSVTGHIAPPDDEKQTIYKALESVGITSSVPMQGNVSVGKKVAMSHSDNLDLVVDGNWIKMKAIHKVDDGTINQTERVADGFIMYHSQPNSNESTTVTLSFKADDNSIAAENLTNIGYGDLLTIIPAEIDRGGHATLSSAKNFKMPTTVGVDQTWDMLTDDDWEDVANPPSMALIAPAINSLQEATQILNTEIFNTLTPENSGSELGLVDRVVALEQVDEVHNTAISELQAAVNSTDGTAKPGLEFKADTKYRLVPIVGSGYVMPQEGASLFNHYNTSKKQEANNTDFYYLEDVNLSLGKYSTAFGQMTQSVGENSLAQGCRTNAGGINSHAEGSTIGIVAKNELLNVLQASDANVADDETTFTISNTEFNKILKELKENYFNSTTNEEAMAYLDHCGIGIIANDTYQILPLKKVNNSVSTSRNIIADYGESTYQNFQGLLYLCLGGALGDNSHVEGLSTIAKANQSHAEGTMTVAAAESAHAEGKFTKSIGAQSHAEGFYSEAIGISAHAEGEKCKALGNNAHAEGYNTEAAYVMPAGTSGLVGEASHAEGILTKASGRGSHAEGVETTATEEGAHAEGTRDNNALVKASGRGSHAEGGGSQATAEYSHAEGQQTHAKHTASHTGGCGTTSGRQYQTVIGMYNETDTDSLFVIGNGSSDGTNIVRKNIFRVTDTSVYGGSYQTIGADYAEYFEWEDQNMAEEDRIGYFVGFGNKDKIRISDGTDILGVISATAAIVANSQDDYWVGKYQKDIYGRPIYEEQTDLNGFPVLIQKINPDYNDEMQYIPRSQRSEWAIVGMLGRLIVRDDGTCEVGKYCTSNNRGIATSSATGYRVLKRLDDSHIQILFK